MNEISLYDDCVMLVYNKEVRENCLPFTCGESDLDDFFFNDAELYAEELFGKTYCWVTTESPHRIVALFTLSNDSIKTKLMSSNDKNRLQRNILNPKRGRSYPEVLIGRLGVNRDKQSICRKHPDYRLADRKVRFPTHAQAVKSVLVKKHDATIVLPRWQKDYP